MLASFVCSFYCLFLWMQWLNLFRARHFFSLYGTLYIWISVCEFSLSSSLCYTIRRCCGEFVLLCFVLYCWQFYFCHFKRKKQLLKFWRPSFFSSVLTKPRLPLIPRCMSRHWRNLFLLCLICCVATHFRCIHGVRIDVVVVVVNILLKKLTRELLCAWVAVPSPGCHWRWRLPVRVPPRSVAHPR